MGALERGSPNATDLSAPDGLPGWAAFAVIRPFEPTPAIDPRERAALGASAVPSRRDAFCRGRSAAHDALRRVGLDRGPILSGPNREPLWPPGAVGSISHAAGFAVALVAPEGCTDGVGVDIEKLRRAPELRDEVLRDEERTWVDSLDATDQEAAIFALFSAKESVFKAFFGRYGSFFGFEAALLLPSPTGFSGSLVADLDDEYPPERSFVVTCRWFGDLVLTSLVLPKTPAPPAP